MNRPSKASSVFGLALLGGHIVPLPALIARQTMLKTRRKPNQRQARKRERNLRSNGGRWR